ncbi:ribulose-5-phosphate 3-epimerase [Rhodotorula diobovata]|uniref:Ribulose-phosphate 3-epimerase n=1 Tax=Rhodotorula diobovata TaxID=5288 RepID=A0A5C5G7Q2_9BASI|nr:ribulose-5-phosphate 3-epimerase [Rhodotorula diobovata]
MAASPRAIVSPSVLASNFADLGNEIKRMMHCGAEWVHMDVMDGHFVPNITMGAPVLASVNKTVDNVFMDCHMMVADPARWVKPVAEAGGKSYTFHIEALSHPGASPLLASPGFPRPRPDSRAPRHFVHTESAHELVELIHSTGMRAAVAISPDTPSSAISDKLGQSVDMLLVMTVVPGAGGQKFMRQCVPKVAELRTRFPNKDIQVDGGVGPGTVGCCARAGACLPSSASLSLSRVRCGKRRTDDERTPPPGSNVIVAGTALFGADKPDEVITDFKRQVDEGKSVWGTKEALEDDK